VIKISKAAACQTGTSANLRPGDSVSVRDLLYGMMLPSGNDAAYALAEFFGNIF
jgi:D-alanyl-D-alanine carboxypeptidase (penicillin-binding protein 5/6)